MRVTGKPSLLWSLFLVQTLLGLGPTLVWGQDPTDLPVSFAIRVWGANDGLPVDDIYDIAQTTDGYLWLATRGGLARFDGLRFTVFKAIDHEGLITNNLRRLFADSHGRLWIMTFQQQLVLYEDGHFVHMDAERGLPDLVTRPLIYTRPISEDASGTVWIAHTQGISQYDPATQTLVPYYPETLTSPVVTQFADSQGRYWFGTHDGLIWKQEGESFTSYTLPDGPTGNVVWDISEVDGRVWFATEVGPYVSENNVPRPYTVNGQTFPETRYLYHDADGGLWLDDLFGSVVYHRGNRTISLENLTERIGGRPLFPWTTDLRWAVRDSLLYYNQHSVLNMGDGAVVQSFLVDKEASIWLGTTNGLFQLRTSPFTTWRRPGDNAVTQAFPVLQGPDGTVWVGVLLNDLLRISGSNVSVWTASTGFDIGHPWALHTDRRGNVWAGGYNLCQIEGDRCIPLDPPLEEIHGETRAIFEDSHGWFWLGGEHGVARRRENVPWQPFMETHDYPPFWTQAITETSDGAVWFGTFGSGVYRYKDDQLQGWQKASGFCSDNVSSFYEDEKGYLWVTTDDQGLCRIANHGVPILTDANVVQLGPQQGLYDSSIHSLVEDDFGRFWMGTHQGIFSVYRDSLYAVADGRKANVISVVYDERDGMLSQEVSTNIQPASLKDRSGRIWFPTQNGVAMLDPAQIQEHAHTPTSVVEAVVVGNSVFVPEGVVTLAPNQRELEIEYTALSFIKSSDIRFRYRLLGLDTAWREAGTDRKIRFTNLDPGTYTFQVKAANRFGVWSDAVAELVVERKPYFYETRFFLLVVLIAFFVGVAGVFRYRVYRVRQRNQELEAKVAQRTEALETALAQVAHQAEELQSLDETKSRFFANVSHEFRTPLTLIRGHLSDLQQQRFGTLPTDEAHDALGMALIQTERLHQLVEQLLALARLEAEELKLQTKPTDIVAFVERHVSFFASLAEKNQIDLRFHGPEEPLLLYVDIRHLEKVVSNLLSNALKFTPTGGSIQVTVEPSPQATERSVGTFASIIVADTGIGISAKDLSRIFDRFYQVDSSATRRFEGTGVGLALTKELVELHGGSISVQSILQEGTTFTIRLPYGWAHLADDEIVTDVPTPHAERERSRPIPVGPYTDTQSPDTVGSGDGAPIETLEANILVVEDNPDLRAYLAGHLRDIYTVLEAEDGQAALDVIAQTAVDLVISDVMMPRLDGMSLLQQLKAHPEWQTIPVMLLTARADENDRLQGLQARADDYLAKPFNLTELLVRVRNLVTLRQAMQAQFHQKVVAVAAETLDLADEDTVFLETIRATVILNVGNEAFDIAQLAEAVHMSRSTLLRRLKALTGLTPTAYIRKLRMEHARQLMEQGQAKTVAEVAAAVGFKDQGYFSRLYRKAYGHTPGSLLDR